MDDFEKLVEKCRKSGKYFTIHNASREHAKILFRHLIRDAKDKNEGIRLLSGRLDSSFYDDLSSDINEALKTGVSVKVLIADSSGVDGYSQLTIDLLRKNNNGDVHFLHNANVPHFLVVGNNKYRLELDDATSKAQANFNDDVTGKMLVSLFDDAWEASNSVLPMKS